MKINIKYSLDAGMANPCEAITTLPNGTVVVGCGPTFDKAKERVLFKIREMVINQIPQAEEVEI